MIQQAYRREALKYHPDKLGYNVDEKTKSMIAEVNLAYEILSSPEKRELYYTYGDYSLTDLDLDNVKSNNGLEMRDMIEKAYKNAIRFIAVLAAAWVLYKVL